MCTNEHNFPTPLTHHNQTGKFELFCVSFRSDFRDSRIDGVVLVWREGSQKIQRERVQTRTKNKLVQQKYSENFHVIMNQNKMLE